MENTNNLTIAIPEQLAKFDSIRGQILSLSEQCKMIVINSNESLETAKLLAKGAKKVETIIEDIRKEVTKPLLDEQRKIKAFADGLTLELNQSTKGLRSQILSYEQEQENIRRAEMARLAKEREEKETEMRRKEEEMRKQAEAENKVDEAELLKLRQESEKLKAIEEQQRAVAATASKSIRMVWDFELTDLKLVPIDYLTVDIQTVKAAISDGVRNIPGIRIFQKEQLNLR